MGTSNPYSSPVVALTLVFGPWFPDKVTNPQNGCPYHNVVTGLPGSPMISLLIPCVEDLGDLENLVGRF